MVRISMEYSGELRCKAVHGPSGSELVTDAPTDNQGRGEAFSPTDLVATALVTCMTTIMGIRAREHGWNLEGLRVEVEKVMSSDAPRRITALPVTMTMPVSLRDEHRQIAEDAARNCPVIKSIHPDIRVDLVIRWPEATA